MVGERQAGYSLDLLRTWPCLSSCTRRKLDLQFANISKHQELNCAENGIFYIWSGLKAAGPAEAASKRQQARGGESKGDLLLNKGSESVWRGSEKKVTRIKGNREIALKKRMAKKERNKVSFSPFPFRLNARVRRHVGLEHMQWPAGRSFLCLISHAFCVERETED